MSSTWHSILCCPETHQKLVLLTGEQLKTVNQQIQERKLQNKAGATLEDPLEQGFIREDQRVLYPVRNHIPILLIDEGILLPPSTP